MAQTAPTKGNLNSAKRSRALAETGYELMDRKRNILIREIMGLIDEAEDLQARIDRTFSEAYASMRLAEISMGGSAERRRRRPHRRQLFPALPQRHGRRAALGRVRAAAASRPALRPRLHELGPRRRLLQVRGGQGAHLRARPDRKQHLSPGLRNQKAQKRANALQNIVIPGLDSEISRISDALEERSARSSFGSRWSRAASRRRTVINTKNWRRTQ